MEEMETPASSSEPASESLLEKPARRAAVWSGVRSVLPLPSSSSSVVCSVSTTGSSSAAGSCTIVVLAFLSADFGGAGLSADFAILIFFVDVVTPSALLRFLLIFSAAICGGG